MTSMAKAPAETKAKADKIVVKAPTDVYTALLAIATVFVAVGLAYVGWRSLALFGSILPRSVL